MSKTNSGQLGELLLDGGSWRLYRGGVANRGKSILWQDVEELYISGSKSTVEFIIPAGEKQTIKIIDSHKNSVKVTLSGLFRMSEAKRQGFADIYTFILSNIAERQWKQFHQSLADGKRISFGYLDISREGIYYKKIFGRQRIGKTFITGFDIRKGEFYLQYLNDKMKLTESNIGYVENIPNMHILQAFIKDPSEQNIEE